MRTDKKRKTAYLFCGLALLLTPAALILCAVYEPDMRVLLSFSAVLLSMLPFFAAFEKGRPTAADLQPIVILAALACVGRLIFAAAPNFKPVTAIVIIAGLSLGPSSGFFCGALSAFASNLFFGQGAWTPWQMYAWGLIGFFSGFIPRPEDSRIRICVWGAAASLLYGLITDSWTVVGFVSPVTGKAVLAVLAAGLPFSLIHAASTVLFLLLLCRPWLRIIRRIRQKYL